MGLRRPSLEQCASSAGLVGCCCHTWGRPTSPHTALPARTSLRKSHGGWIPRPVARTSSPRVHGSGFVVCRTRARWDRAHQGYAGPARGRTSTSITGSWAPSLRSERAVAPANPGELCSFTASRAPDQTTSAGPVCARGHVLQVRRGNCWSMFLPPVCT